MSIEFTHFIGGNHVKGTSGRFADVFQPMDGTVRGRVPLAQGRRVGRRGREPRETETQNRRSIFLDQARGADPDKRRLI